MPLYYARVDTPASGTDYAIPFDYIDRSHVVVEVAGSAAAFTFLTDSSIRLTATPTTGQTVTIRRETSPAVRLVNFTNTTGLDSNTLNLATLQEFYLAQEAADKVAALEDAILNLVVGAGNVPGPEAGDIGRALFATGIGTYDWLAITADQLVGVASIADVDAAEAAANAYALGLVNTLTTTVNGKANASRTITGTKSLTGGGDLSADRTIELVGDSPAPGNSKYWGTNGSGAKGFYDLPAGGGGGTVTAGQSVGSGLALYVSTTSGLIRIRSVKAQVNSTGVGIYAGASLTATADTDGSLLLTLTNIYTPDGGGA